MNSDMSQPAAENEPRGGFRRTGAVTEYHRCWERHFIHSYGVSATKFESWGQWYRPKKMLDSSSQMESEISFLGDILPYFSCCNCIIFTQLLGEGCM